MMTTKTLKKNIPKGWKKTKIGEVPEDWLVIKLGEFSTITRGGSPRPIEDFITKTKDGLNWLKIGDIEHGAKYIVHTRQKIKKSGLSKTTLVHKGDFILSNSMSFGRPYIMKINACVHDGWLAFKDIKTRIISSEFLYYLLSSKSLQDNFWVIAAGSGVKNLKKESVANIAVALPSISEQKKIAEILGAVDEDIVKTQEVIEATEKLKQGLMQKLFKKKKGWKILKMENICKVRQGLQIPISRRFKERAGNRFQYITIKSLKEQDFEYIENPKQSVVCKEDDILMTRTGNTGQVVTNVSGVFHNNFFLVDFDRDEVIKEFLVYRLESKEIQMMILDRAGTTTIPDLNHGDFYSLPFVKPAKNEQQEIIEILSSVDEKISINKKLKEKLILLKKGLMQDLLGGKVRVNN